MNAKQHRALNATSAWALRKEIGTLCIQIKEAADCLEDEIDAKHWTSVNKLLGDIATASEAAKVKLHETKSVHPGAAYRGGNY